MIWFRPYTLDQVRFFGNSLPQHLGIEFTELGADFLRGRMPVDDRTRQPYGILHGGASVALAETLGSTGAGLIVDPDKYYCVGQEINANHVRAVRDGFVIGTAAAPGAPQSRVGNPHRRRAGAPGVHLAHHDVRDGAQPGRRRLARQKPRLLPGVSKGPRPLSTEN
jgi:1,4-dihydroxy-2-naphthoyl-CoA hydrolase